MKDTKEEIRSRMITSIIAALGLVIGLAWNDAIMALMTVLFPANEGVVAKFIYATVITISLALAIFYISRIESREKNKK